MFPTLSVTVIGFAIGGYVAVSRPGGWQHVLAGLAGAWVGFAAGALLGVAIDVIFATGVWVALVGHVLAVVGALVAIRRLAVTATE